MNKLIYELKENGVHDLTFIIAGLLVGFILKANGILY